MSEQPRNEAELVEEAWQAALSGQLTPSQSLRIHQAKGIVIPPNLPEPRSPVSPLNQHVVQATDTVMETTASNVKRNLRRYDVRDLMTGENIINLVMREPTAEDNLRITPEHIHSLPDFYENGRNVDVRLLVDEVDRVLIPGFKMLLTADELASCASAPPYLSKKIDCEIMRATLASRADNLIATIDHGLENRIAPLLTKIRNKRVQASIQACLDVWRANANNPYRNTYRRTARLAATDPFLQSDYGRAIAQIDHRYFSVDVIHEELADIKNLGAVFTVEAQMMMFHEPAGEMEFTELLHVIHELTHKVHDARRIQQLGAHAALDVDASVPKNVLLGITDEDPEAIANEVELFIARTGFGTLHVGDIAEQLGMRSEKKFKVIHRLLQYAATYFEKGYGPNETVHPEFSAFIASEYQRLGAIMLTKDASGRMVRKP